MERFKKFIIVNDVTKKISLFLTVIGPKCYEVFAK